jgi:two-component system alkaline phosphatase synthesis response regulator PhoP
MPDTLTTYKVLIIDDEELLRHYYSFCFEKAGFTVFEATNGMQGLEIAAKELPDLIILDLIMPGMLGFEVCKRLRENPSFSNTAIIITSAKSYKPDIDKALQLGADAYVTKPVDHEDLIKISMEKINQRKAARA